ncbi:hypothetical protein HAX54_006104, partial [Datura stramonium]|nr:hypothetical protein [Datura stramonium]
TPSQSRRNINQDLTGLPFTFAFSLFALAVPRAPALYYCNWCPFHREEGTTTRFQMLSNMVLMVRKHP